MATRKLYFDDVTLLQFEAQVVAIAACKGKPSIVLDQTAFYPEAGGQLADRGTLRCDAEELAVVDVQIDDSEVIHHVVDRAPDGLVGKSVRGEVDAGVRRDMMVQHTAQHMLSRALIEAASADTVSARLGAQTCTIDVSVPQLERGQIARAEDFVNDAVLQDRPIRALFPSPEQLATLPLRRRPKVDHDIRVIEIDGYDWSPCGGTHCTRTSQVGLVHVTKVEKYKGLTRVTFVAGRRSLQDYRAKDEVLRSVSLAMTCGFEELGAAIGKLRQDLADRKQELFLLRERYANVLAAAWHAQNAPAGAVTWAVIAEEQMDVPGLRMLAAAFASRADVVAVIGSKDASGDWQLVVERGKDAQLDAGAWFKSLAARFGGRGGGGRDHAEGRLPGSIALGQLPGE